MANNLGVAFSLVFSMVKFFHECIAVIFKKKKLSNVNLNFWPYWNSGAKIIEFYNNCFKFFFCRLESLKVAHMM